jgi:hypothetical protein
LFDFLDRHVQLCAPVPVRPSFVRQEFVQRRIEKTDRRRETFQGLENADEIRR